MSVLEECLCNMSLNDCEADWYKMRHNQLSTILHELQNNRVSVSCGKFKVTFGLLASVSLAN